VSVTGWVALIGATLAGIGGIISAWAGLVRARNEGAEECEQRLRELRAENVKVADELHELRMRKMGGG
jgi:hypothetical protein